MSTTAKAQKTYRAMFKFWLNLNNDADLALSDYIEGLKQTRQFTTTLRNAMRLIRDLSDGRLDVLFELFPWLNAWLEDRAQAIARNMIKSDHNGGGGEGRDPIIARLDRIEQLVAVQATSAGSGGMLMAARENLLALPEPLPDEPTIQITRAKVDPDRIFNNFMSSLQAVGASPQTINPKTMLGAAVQFAVPDFDDL